MHRKWNTHIVNWTLVHARHEEVSKRLSRKETDKPRGNTSLKPWQLSWNLDDEKKFASQRGGGSSRKEDQLVSRWKRACCIQVLYLRMSRKVPCREQRKRGQATKGCLEDSREGGSSGETQSDLDPCYSHCLSASPWKERLLFVLAATRPCEYQDITDPWPKKTGQ